jgi:hypothetical protein
LRRWLSSVSVAGTVAAGVDSDDHPIVNVGVSAAGVDGADRALIKGRLQEREVVRARSSVVGGCVVACATRRLIIVSETEGAGGQPGQDDDMRAKRKHHA